MKWLALAAAVWGVACGGGAKRVVAPAAAVPKYEGCETVEACTTDCDAGQGDACLALAHYVDAGVGPGASLDEAGREARYLELMSRAARLFQAGCDAGNGEACSSLGLSYENGRGVDRDLGRANQIYEKACQLGDGTGCWFLGYNLSNGKGGRSPDVKRALVILEKACEGGDPDSCSSAADLLSDSPIRDPARAAKLKARALAAYEDECARKVEVSCAMAAMEYESGDDEGRGADAGRARELYEQGCQNGEGDDCNSAAALLDAEGASERAADLRRRGCELEDPASCRDGGDAARAREIWQRQCERGSWWSCDTLAEHLAGSAPADAELAAATFARATAGFQRACRRGDASSCTRAARNLAEGRGGPADPEGARALDDRACDLGLGYLCHTLAERRAAAQDDAQAAVYHQKGCAGGSSLSCWALFEIYAAGRGVARDPQKAEESHQRACDLGHWRCYPDDE